MLASVGGRGIRVEKKPPSHLPDKTRIDNQLIEHALSHTTPLMQGWLSYLETELKHDTNWFHRSMQIWQALGIVSYNLVHDSEFENVNLHEAGVILGQLDYSKSADHWVNNQAFKKDINNKLWSNATGGGLTLRDKITEYFTEVLKQHFVDS